MDRLQAEVGPGRVRRRGHALRALAAHLAPGHRPLQQVSAVVRADNNDEGNHLRQSYV